jgi:hypothetical protein
VAKSNELGQFGAFVTVDSSSDNVFLGPTVSPSISIDTNTGIITASEYVGSFTGNVSGNVNSTGFSTFSDISIDNSVSIGKNITSVNNINCTGISTFPTISSSNITTNVGIVSDLNATNFSVGIGTITNNNVVSQHQKIKFVSGNTVNSSYGEADIFYVDGATSDITVNISDMTFYENMGAIVFSVVVGQSGVARTCTNLTVNATAKQIKWFKGSLERSIIGVTTDSGYDIFNFIGINTSNVSKPSINDIEFFGIVNGCFF